MFLNLYVCPHCATVWTDTWSATVDDDCPGCGCRHISPTESEWQEPVKQEEIEKYDIRAF